MARYLVRIGCISEMAGAGDIVISTNGNNATNSVLYRCNTKGVCLSGLSIMATATTATTTKAAPLGRSLNTYFRNRTVSHPV